MSTIDEEDVEDNEEVGQSITPAGKMSFIIDPKQHADAKLLRRLDRETKVALDTLMEIISDKEAPIKERRLAAESIVTIRNNVSDKIGKEVLNRLVLESKQMMMSFPKMKTLESSDEDLDSPNVIVDFSLIQSTTPVDLSNIKL